MARSGLTSEDVDLDQCSWSPSTFVVEDIIRRERFAHPHSQTYFWRTAAGAELDLVIERNGRRHGIEVKTARASSSYLARSLAKIATDLDLASMTVIDQADGTEPLRPGIERRGFGAALDWLP